MVKKTDSWQDYEHTIYTLLRRKYPQAKIEHNVRTRGRNTGRLRQIDISVETSLLGLPLKLAFDCKCYNKRVDVKEVEAMIGMMLDLDYNQGIIITNVGYTDAAEKAAKASKLLLRTSRATLADIDQTTAMGIPYKCGWAYTVFVPSGWVLDTLQYSDKAPGLCRLFRKGLLPQEAWEKSKDFIYADMIVLRAHDGTEFEGIKTFEGVIESHLATRRSPGLMASC